MACRADRMDWHGATPSFGPASPRWACRGQQVQAAGEQLRRSGPPADGTTARLRAALAPTDADLVTAGIIDRLREHHHLPPAVAGAAP